MAPELMNVENCMYGPSVDIYSFAMIMYEFLSCGKPWREFHDSMVVVRHVTSGKRPQIPKERCVPDFYLELMKRCWSHDMLKRPLIDVVCRKIAEIRTREVSKATQKYEEKMQNTKDEKKWDGSIFLPRTVSLISHQTNSSITHHASSEYSTSEESQSSQSSTSSCLRGKARSSSLESTLNARRTPANSPRLLPLRADHCRLSPPSRRSPTSVLRLSSAEFNKLGMIHENKPHSLSMEKLDLLL